MVLCQVQEFNQNKGTEEFRPRKVKVGRFLADTGAQVNVGNYTMFDIMGIPEEEREKYLTDAPDMKINGIRGEVGSNLRSVNVMVHSLKTRISIPTTFFISNELQHT